jgi:hypothetical protein
MTIKSIRKMQTEGLVPAKDYNNLAEVIRQIQNMSVAGGLELTKGANGWNLSFVRVPLIILTFGVEGLLVENAQNVAKKLRLIKPFTIIDVVAYVGVASTSGTVDLDIHLANTAADSDNGTTIYPSAAKPSIAQDAFIDTSSVPDTLNIAAGKFLQIDIDSVGVGAENLNVLIYGKE